ncbi:MAG: MFS transporter [Verrucomicrobiota bacterium]
MRPSRASSPWILLALLLSAVTINYIDRGSLSVAAPLISQQFSLDEIQTGWLLSAFFWSYALFQLVAGWLVDRYDVKWVYALGFLMWSLAMAATGFVTTFSALLIARLLLGIGESVNYPACAKILARQFPEHERGFANGLVDAGSKIGPALSTLIGGLVVDRFGWPALFIGMGIGSLFWLLPWIFFMPSMTTRQKKEKVVSPSMLRILSVKEAWGTSLGMFALGYVWYFLLTWLPTYLVKERHLSMTMMALLGSLPFWGMALTSILGGWVSDQLIARGGTPTRVRKTFIIGGLLCCSVLMQGAAYVKDNSVSMILLVGASLSLGVFTSNVWAVTQTLAGPSAAGKWAGIQNCIGNLGGVMSPPITGWIVAKTGSFFFAFTAASTMLLFGILAYIVFVPKIVPIAWGELGKSERPMPEPKPAA